MEVWYYRGEGMDFSNPHVRSLITCIVIAGLFWWFTSAVIIGKDGSNLPPEISYVDISRSTGGGIDSRGRVGVIITLTNNSNKTLVKGSYSIRAVDVSGRLLSSDCAYPENVRPGGSRTATVWMKLPVGAKLQGEWLSAKFR